MDFPTTTQSVSHEPERAAQLEPALAHFTAARTRHLLLILLLLAGDTLALLLAFGLAYLARFQNPWLPYYATQSLTFYSWLAFWAIPLWLVVFAFYRLYDTELLFGGVEEYARVLHACSIGVIVLILYSFLNREPDSNELSRLWLVFVSALGTLLVGLGRFTMRRLVYALRRRGHLRRRTLIVGSNSEAQAIAERLNSAQSTGLDVIGFIATGAPGSELVVGAPLLGRLADLADIITRRQVDELIIASTALTRDQLLETFNTYGLAPQLELSVTPGLYEIVTTGARIRQMSDMPLVSLNRLRITGVDAALKRAMDIGLVVAALPLLALLLPLIALLVRLDSPGPILHRRRVLGVGGRPFDALKFRSMVVDADARLEELLARDAQARAEYQRDWKLRDDPRVTRMGRFLRRTSLDELPQLSNVLLGQMSLVGPRIIAPEEIRRYGKWWLNLLTVKPGLTGPWQVMGRNDLTYEERVRLSMNYVRNHTLWLDVQILFQTAFVVLRGTGI